MNTASASPLVEYERHRGVKLSAAARALQSKGLKDLPGDEVARFNRLAIEAAYPDEIAPIPRKQIQLAYFSWELGLPLPVEPAMSTCGIDARSAVTMRPLMSLPMAMVSRAFDLAKVSLSSTSRR